MTYIGENQELIINAIDKLIKENKVVNINNIYVHMNQYENLKKSIIELLTTYHKKHRLRSGVLKEEVRSKAESKFKTKDMDILLDKLQNEKIIKVDENLVSIYDFEVILNDKRKEIKDNIQKN